jgi:hypothetical protein
MQNKMQVTTQFGFKRSIDRLIQLIYLSSNVFSSIEISDNVCAINLKENKYSEEERKKLLTYFLDLIDSLSLEKIYLTQDPNNELRYYYNGGF